MCFGLNLGVFKGKKILGFSKSRDINGEKVPGYTEKPKLLVEKFDKKHPKGAPFFLEKHLEII